MEAKKQGSKDQHARAQEVALESGDVYSQVKPRHLRNTAPALNESQKDACMGQKLHTDSANRTNTDDHAEHEFRNGSDDRTKKVCIETEDRANKATPEEQKVCTETEDRANNATPEGQKVCTETEDRANKATPEEQKVCTETEDRANKATPEGQKVCTETEDRANKATPEGQKVCTKTEDRANKATPEGQIVCTETEDRANKATPEGQKVCTKTEDRANKDIHAAACSNKSILEEKRLHGKTNVHKEAPQQAAEAEQTSSSSFPPDIGTTCERDAHETNQATGDCSRQDAASCDREPGAESTMNVSELGPSQQGSQAEDNAADRKIESFGMRVNQPATLRWIAEEDDGSIKDDGYCLLIRAGDSPVTVSKSRVKFARPISKEEWFPFSLTDRGQLQEHPEARSQSGAGLKDNTRREHSDPHADGWSCLGDASCNEQQQQQQQQQQRQEGLHSDARTDDTVQRPKLTRKHSLTLEEGCMLVFPYAVRDVTEGIEEASADRQTSGRDSSGGSADGFRHNRQTGSERNVNVVSGTCGSTAEDASEEGVVDGEARTSFDSTERKNCTGTGAFQHSPQQTRKDQAGASQLSPQQTRKESGALKLSRQQTRKDSGAFQLSPQQTKKDSGALKLSAQQTRKDGLPALQLSPQQAGNDWAAAFQRSLQQTRKDSGAIEKDSGDLQRSPQQTRKDSGALKRSPQQTRKDSGALKRSPQQTRKDSGADPSHSGVILLQTCSACLLPSSELTLMQCFHIVCPACISLEEPDCVQCNVCKATQAVPPEDAPSLRDLFPGFFQAVSCLSEAASQTVPSEDCTEHLASPEGQAEKPTPKEKSPTNNPDGCEIEAQPDEVTEECDSLSSSSSSSGSSSSIKAAAAARPTQTCGACQERTETRHACVTCGGIPLCGGCRTAHLHLPVTRSHEVVTATATSLSPLTLLGRHQPVCPRHGQDLALQCCTCGLFLCHRCLAPQHASHEIRELGTLYHTGRKQFSGLQRSIKQYVLVARSARRAADEQLRKVREGRRRACESIAATAQWCIDGIADQAEKLSRAVVRTSEAREFVLAKSQSEVARVQREGERLRSVLEAVCGDTPHLTGLVLHHNCQVRLNRLRRDACLQVEEFEDVVFCPGMQLQEQVASQASLGTVRALATGLPDTVLHVLGTFQTGGEVSSLAPTPYGELVCISSSVGTCRVWDRQGVMICDVSRHVTEPADVRVTPNGLLVILGLDSQSTEGNACLTLLSPAGSLLTRFPLSSQVPFTRFHCQSDTRILVSDELSQTVTLYAIEKADKPGCCCLRTVRQVVVHHYHGLLVSPRHVTINPTGDWLVNDGGYFLRAMSPEGEVTTVLSEDDPEAVKQPPRSSRYEDCQLSKTRWLTSVWCDSSGRMLVADVGKNGVYIATAGTSENRGERVFLSLQEVTSAARLTAMAVDKHDRLIVGLSDGSVYILKIGSDEYSSVTNSRM